MVRQMSLLSHVSYTCLLPVVVFKLLQELLFVCLINYKTKVGLEWIIRTENKIWQCDLKLLFIRFWQEVFNLAQVFFWDNLGLRIGESLIGDQLLAYELFQSLTEDFLLLHLRSFRVFLICWFSHAFSKGNSRLISIWLRALLLITREHHTLSVEVQLSQLYILFAFRFWWQLERFNWVFGILKMILERVHFQLFEKVITIRI